MVIGMEIYSEIRTAYLSGASQRSVANRLGISRQTVKRYGEREPVLGERKECLREPTVVTDEAKSFILNFREYNQVTGLKKQKHTEKESMAVLLRSSAFRTHAASSGLQSVR